MTEEQKPYEQLERDKWQAWREQCPAKTGLSLETCNVSMCRCAMDNCIIWKARALILAEGRP